MSDRAVLFIMTLVVGLFLALDLRANEVSKQPGEQCRAYWTLPTEAIDGSPLTGEAALTAVEVYWELNMDPAGASTVKATLPPDATEWVVDCDSTFGWGHEDRIAVGAKAVNNAGRSALSVLGGWTLEVPVANPPAPGGVE